MTIEIKQLQTSNGRIITTGKNFTLPPNNSCIVSKIVYCRKGYNKGFQGDFPAYKIEFENSTIKMIVAEKEIAIFFVEKTIETKKIIPELPEIEETITSDLQEMAAIPDPVELP